MVGRRSRGLITDDRPYHDLVGTGSTRSHFNPCAVQATRRDTGNARRLSICQNTRMVFRPPQGLITDGVETVPTKGGDRTLLSRF